MFVSSPWISLFEVPPGVKGLGGLDARALYGHFTLVSGKSPASSKLEPSRTICTRAVEHSALEPSATEGSFQIFLDATLRGLYKA